MAMQVERALAKEIEAELASNKILIITGPRQAGKTTLLSQFAAASKERGEQSYYYNFDRLADLEFFNKQQKVEAFLRIRSAKQRLLVFVDEVQRKKDAGTFFKYFYDAGVNVKFVFSGSSSVELTDSFGDALTGRKRIFTLLPFSFSELGAARLGEEWQFAEMQEPMAVEKCQELTDELLIWGSYPEVSQKQTETAKLRTLGELYESYVQKDVKDLLRVKNIGGFNQLLRLISYNAGLPLVVEDLVRQTSLHANTVNSYLDILEGTMILGRLDNFNPEFSSNLPKSKRYYFIDNGMRNYALNQLQTGFRADTQQLAGNLIYSELRKLQELSGGKDLLLNHYQTYSDNHVDFILSSKTGGNYLPILVRYQDNSQVLGKKVHEFLGSKQPGRMIIVTRDLEAENTVKGCQLQFVPLTNLLLQLPALASLD
jgi:predicted AAA+ superfamily ATPase